MSEIPKARYIGHCIYCGAFDRLSDEHILPEGMGGRDILKDASCEACRVVTCRLEGHVLQKMIYPMRIRMGIRGRRKHPETIPTKLHKSSGEVAIERVDPRDVVMAAMLPRLTPPGLLTDSPKHEVRAAELDIYGNPDSVAKLAAKGFTGQTSHQIRIHWFARALAKIAHAGAIQRLGANGFEPFLPDVIRGTAEEVYYYVGCERMTCPPPDSEFGSWLRSEVLICKAGRLVVMYVRLLAQIGTPVYQIVAGRIPY